MSSTATSSMTLQVPMPELVPYSATPSPMRVSSQTPPPALLSPSPSPKCDFRRTPGKSMQGVEEDLTGIVSIALSVLNSIAQGSPDVNKKTLPLPPLLSPEQEQGERLQLLSSVIKASMDLPELIAAVDDDVSASEIDFDADLLALPDLLSLSPQPIPTPELIPLTPEDRASRRSYYNNSPWTAKTLANVFNMLG